MPGKVFAQSPADHLRVVLVIDLALALLIPVLRRDCGVLLAHSATHDHLHFPEIWHIRGDPLAHRPAFLDVFL